MSTQPILKRLGSAVKGATDTAKDYVAGLKALPVSDEGAGLRAVAENVYAPESKAVPEAQSTGTELLHPSARYGDKPGEVRYEVDAHGNLNPITPIQPAGMKPIAAPVYDKGGDVAIAAGNKAQAEGNQRIQSLIDAPTEPVPMPSQEPTQPAKQSEGAAKLGATIQQLRDNKYETKMNNVKAPTYMPGGEPGGEPAMAAPPGMPQIATSMPVYDDGGVVDVNDGKHQVAILKEGERVLTPEQNAQYKAEHADKAPAAPADKSTEGMQDIYMPHVEDPQKVQDKLMQKQMHDEYLDRSSRETNMADATAPSELKPYAQFRDEKAKAAQKVNNPGAQTVASDSTETQVQPKEERGTPQERQAIETDKKKAMGQGVDGFVNLGTALIHENSLTPTKERNQGAEDKGAMEGGLKAPQGTNQGGPGLPPIGGPEASAANKVEPITSESTETQVQPRGPGLAPIAPPEQSQAKAGGPLTVGAQPTSETKGEQHDLAGMEHKAKLAQYDKQIQSALNEGTAEGQEKADRLQLAKQQYVKSTPWGSEGNHPGILGKLGHVAEEVGARLPIIRQVVANIPGSEAQRNAQHAATLGQMDKDTALATARESEENRPEKQGTVPATAEQTQDYQQRIANSGLTGKALETYSKAPVGSTASELDKRFDEAIKLRGMNQKDADTQVAEQDRKDKAADMKFQHDQTRQDKLAKAYYTYTDKTGTHITTGDKLDELPDDAQLLPVKDVSSLIGEGRAMNAVQENLNTLHKDLDEHPEVFDNAEARTIVQTTTEQMNRAAAGLLIAGTGGSVPIPSGFGDMLNTALQNNALDEKTSRAVKNYIADYKAIKDKAMVIQMMMQNGKMGRGGQQAFESIVNQIPGGSTADSITAKRQMAAIQQTATGLMGKYPEEYADFKKEKPYEPKAKAAAIPEPPVGATHPVYKSATDKTIIGYMVNGKYQAAEAK